MRNKNVLILAGVAVVLLVLAYLLSRGSAEGSLSTSADGGPVVDNKLSTKSTKPPRDKPIVFPRDMPKNDKPTPPADQPKLDAMQRALLGSANAKEKGAIFVEANAIRHSPLMEKILKCRNGEAANGLSEMKEQLGIDPSEDIDRLGFDGDVFVATGFFDKLKIPPEVGSGVSYGDTGRIWFVKDDNGQQMVFGKVGDGMLVTGASDADVKGAIDRAEGRGSAPLPSGLPPGFGEGEVYGTVGPAFLASVLGGTGDPTMQSIAKLVTSSTVRMNVDEDAALSLDMQAVDEGSAKDLSNAVGGVLAGLHARAQQDGDAELSQLLEQARVSPQAGGRFNVDVAVPGDTLLQGMGCKPDGTPLFDGRPMRAPPPAPGP